MSVRPGFFPAHAKQSEIWLIRRIDYAEHNEQRETRTLTKRKEEVSTADQKIKAGQTQLEQQKTDARVKALFARVPKALRKALDGR